MTKITTNLKRLFERCCEPAPFVVCAALLSHLGHEWEMHVHRFGKELPTPTEYFADYLNHPFTPYAIAALILVLPINYRARASLWVTYFVGVIYAMMLPFFFLGNIVRDENASEPPSTRLVWAIVGFAILIFPLRVWRWIRSWKKTSSPE